MMIPNELKTVMLMTIPTVVTMITMLEMLEMLETLIAAGLETHCMCVLPKMPLQTEVVLSLIDHEMSVDVQKWFVWMEISHSMGEDGSLLASPQKLKPLMHLDLQIANAAPPCSQILLQAFLHIESLNSLQYGLPWDPPTPSLPFFQVLVQIGAFARVDSSSPVLNEVNGKFEFFARGSAIREGRQVKPET
jgi:hypothetical protein